MDINTSKSSVNATSNDNAISGEDISMVLLENEPEISVNHNNNDTDGINSLNEGASTSNVMVNGEKSESLRELCAPEVRFNPFHRHSKLHLGGKHLKRPRMMENVTDNNNNNSGKRKKIELNDLVAVDVNGNEKNVPSNGDINKNLFKRKGKTTPNDASFVHQTKEIYVSPFRPHVEPADIIELLKSKSQTRHFADQIICSKLVKSGMVPKSYKFVSFKLTVPSKYFDRMLSSSVWSNHITAKEFQHKDSNFQMQQNLFISKNVNQRQTLDSMTFMGSHRQHQINCNAVNRCITNHCLNQCKRRHQSHKLNQCC